MDDLPLEGTETTGSTVPEEVFAPSDSVPEPVQETKPTPVPVTPKVIEVANYGRNSVMAFPVFREKDTSTNDSSLPYLSLPIGKTEDTATLIENLPNIDIENSKDLETWVNVLKQGNNTAMAWGVFDKTSSDKEAEFKQVIKTELGPIAAMVPKMTDDLGSLRGKAAVNRIRSMVGLGGHIQVPMWHSGFWVTFKTPSDGDLLELNRIILSEKISLGRYTHGLAFSNTSVVYSETLINFAIDHIYESSLRPDLLANIKDHLSTLDIPLFIWGLACSIWPRGFNYARAIGSPSTNNYRVLRELVNITKLLWTNNRAVSDWQRAHMANRKSGSTVIGSLERYKTEFIKGRAKSYPVRDNVAVTLHVPNSTEYLKSGNKWVNNIVNLIDTVLGMSADEGEREKQINNHGRASNLRQYAHWIESIKINETIITDEETIEETLNVFSAEKDLRTGIMDSVKNFIDDSTMSIIAIPATEAEDKPELKDFPNLLPIDVMHVFFNLLVQLTTRIEQGD